jgi:hypothetical protein
MTIELLCLLANLIVAGDGCGITCKKFSNVLASGSLLRVVMLMFCYCCVGGHADLAQDVFLNCSSVGVEESIVNALHRLRTNHGSAVSILRFTRMVRSQSTLQRLL